jgi:hypothetical protein
MREKLRLVGMRVILYASPKAAEIEKGNQFRRTQAGMKSSYFVCKVGEQNW